MKVRKYGLKKILKAFVPLGLLQLRRRSQALRNRKQEEKRRARFEQLRGTVPSTIRAIRELLPQQCSDIAFLEHEFIPSIGLNDEGLHQQPPELSRHFGRGLHIWQYPNQLARYLAWIHRNAKHVNSYMEIGCRWGGMTILIAEWLRKSGANLHTVIAIDPIQPTPFIDEYFKFLHEERELGQIGMQGIYIRDYSTSIDVERQVKQVKPDFVFIDGDHGLRGALADHILVRDFARVIVHHDVNSQACPDTTLLWSVLKQLECRDFDFFEFFDQYQSVGTNFLGIGVMNRKES